MANTRSTLVSNAEASPIVPNDVREIHGRVKSMVATIEVAAADNNDHLYVMGKIPTHAIVRSVRVGCDAITSGTDYNCGVYTPNPGGDPVAVDENIFFDAVDLSSAIAFPTEKFGVGTGAANVAVMNTRLWSLAGLSADPGGLFDIALIGVAVGSAAGTITLIVDYTVGD